MLAVIRGGSRWVVVATTLALGTACGGGPTLVGGAPVADGLVVVDGETVAGDTRLDRDAPRDAAGNVQVRIEIPAGTSAKFEVDHASGELRWERRNGAPRVIDYLPYPGSYGFVPSTLSPRDRGGDGDPLDVVVLGPAYPRGALVPVRVVGVLRLLDEGERDDKLIAVPVDGASFREVVDLASLDQRHPGVRRILETWFSHYDGDVIVVEGWADRTEAATLVDDAIAAAP